MRTVGSYKSVGGNTVSELGIGQRLYFVDEDVRDDSKEVEKNL